MGILYFMLKNQNIWLSCFSAMAVCSHGSHFCAVALCCRGWDCCARTPLFVRKGIGGGPKKVS